ncbi:SMP-30/gluconolactonase/LRE family protein [Mycolicibacterium sp. BiH015]|uniref:SMP-30/gluconolactonase/LRE family protein n=1 Tax=Mycolicibacterium sp. BiH015 TaxID=3018808 RepID=UPI0022E19127|nr:SMP-30/gluconolactonase/LRE family protein [Mycolicibacterium sp. BiH015]MDA2895471.1 SMP-30/gluconolactonase/LRE family protein [Mycolicibacterium sp. BiH015]
MPRSAERLTPAFAYHGEGPFWDHRRSRLLCMDVLAGTVAEVDSAGGVHRYPTNSRVATMIRHREKSGFVIATERGIAFADDDLSSFEQIVGLTEDPTVRTNDGGCDRGGGLVVGTMSYDGKSPRGAVYRVGPDLRVVKLLAPVTISNGIQWSADGSRVFYVDTPTRRVDVFDVDTSSGTWSGRRPHIYLDDVAGFPDGMAIDEEDGLWIALWGGGAVNHYDSAGRLVETITIPGVRQVSSCAFGGDRLQTLYITTSRQDLRKDEEPNAGAVFAAEAAIRGAPQAVFRG